MEQRRKVKEECRFCRCPVVDGGVSLPDVDRDKLSEWWSACLDTELDERTLEGAWCCQQCVWNARLLLKFGSSPERNLDCEWWPLEDNLFKKYLECDLKHLILNVAPLQESDFDNLQVHVQKISCNFCEQKFNLPSTLTLHQQNDHGEETGASGLEPRQMSHQRILTIGATSSVSNYDKSKKSHNIFYCTWRGCAQILKSQSSLKHHLESVHNITRDVAKKCKICKSTYACKISLSNHMRLKHPEAVKYKNESHLKIIQAKIRKAQMQIPKTFDCFCCTENYSTKKKLADHLKSSHKNSAIKCKYGSYCDFFFKTKAEMEAHFAKEHQIKCTICPSMVASKHSLYTHIKRNHKAAIKCGFFHCMFHACSKEVIEKHVEESHDRGKKEKSAECIFCKRRFVDLRHRAAHIRRLHAKIAIQCDQQNCLHFVQNSSELEEHKKEAHKKVEKQKKSTICLYCDKPMWDNTTYVGHLKQVHPSEVIRCKHHRCFTFFKTKEDLEKHLKERHVSNFRCDFCGHGASRKDYIADHINKKHLPPDRKCPECGKLCKGYATLKSHIYNVHKNLKKCVHCGEVGTNLNRHVVTAECPVCKKPFPCRNLLSKHKLTCKKDYRCSYCDRKFKIKSELSHHLNDKHKFGAKWKGYKCQKCKRAFYLIKDLKVHRVEAHPRFTKTCVLCEKKLWGLEGLKYHLAMAHKIGGFECKKCDKRFALKHEFDSHLKHNHGKNDPNLQYIECDVCKKILKKSSFKEHYRLLH